MILPWQLPLWVTDSLSRRTTRGGPETPDSRSATAASQTVSGHDDWGACLTFVWVLGAAVLLARMTWSRWLLQRFRQRQLRVEQAAIRQRVNRLAGRLGVGRRVNILASPWLAAPIAFGFLRPAVVLPVSFVDDFDARQQEAMLAHEVAHLAAGDPLWQLLADLAAVLLWWHPLVWWARSQWRQPASWQRTRRVFWFPKAPTRWQRAWSCWLGGWSPARGSLGWRWRGRAYAPRWASESNACSVSRPALGGLRGVGGLAWRQPRFLWSYFLWRFLVRPGHAPGPL